MDGQLPEVRLGLNQFPKPKQHTKTNPTTTKHTKQQAQGNCKGVRQVKQVKRAPLSPSFVLFHHVVSLHAVQ